MTEEIKKINPVTILLTSYNRIELLKKTIQLINERTFFPYRIVVVDNASTDGSQRLLRELKVQGKVFDSLLLTENIGQSKALNKGFDLIEMWENEKRRPSNDFIVTSNEDIFCPMLGAEKCWLKQMIDILERNEPEYGALCMRIQRTPRNEIDETKEIIPCLKGLPSVFRLMRRTDLRKLGDRPFGRLLKWDSNTSGDKYRIQIRKKYGFTTKIFADHAGFIPRKGYGEDLDPFTLAANKLTESEDKPYPDIDPETNVPIKTNHPCDDREHLARARYNEGDKKLETTVIVLTCKRPEGLKRVLDSVKEKTEGDYKILVMADKDDTIAYNYCVENNIECILTNVNNDFVKQANVGIYSCDTPYFVLLGDDSEVITDNWLETALTIFKSKFPDKVGLLAFNDGIQHGRVFTMGMSSKKFVKEIGGYLYYPEYHHFCGDREVTRIARGMKKYHYEKKIEVKHYHWQSDDSVVKDATYSNSMTKHYQEDNRVRDKREKIDFIKEKNFYEY